MSQINLIITCEECGEVTHYREVKDSVVDGIFNGFQCQNGCNRKFLSYITIGQIAIAQNSPAPVQVASIG
jgi:hypothetical protein